MKAWLIPTSIACGIVDNVKANIQDKTQTSRLPKIVWLQHPHNLVTGKKAKKPRQKTTSCPPVWLQHPDRVMTGKALTLDVEASDS